MAQRAIKRAASFIYLNEPRPSHAICFSLRRNGVFTFLFRIRTAAAFLAVAIALCLLGIWRASSQSGVIRRVTNTSEEGLNLNPTLSGDGRRIAFESTE